MWIERNLYIGTILFYRGTGWINRGMRKKFMEILHFTRELNVTYVSSYHSKEWNRKYQRQWSSCNNVMYNWYFDFSIDYKFHDKFDNNRYEPYRVSTLIPETRLIIALKISDFRFDTQWRFIAIRLIVLYLVDLREPVGTGWKTRTCHFCAIRSFPSWFLTRWIISVETRKSTFRKFIPPLYHYISWPT